MKISKLILLGILNVATLCEIAHGAALVTITIDTGNRLLQDQLGNVLTGGSPNIDGDGTIVQVGYYQGATPGNNFGSIGSQWIPLVGSRSVFGLNTLTIGDSGNTATGNGADNGQIFKAGPGDSLNLFLGTNGGANDSMLPPPNTPLSIRFYNAKTITGSTFDQAVSNNLWLWKTPLDAPNQPLIALNFDSAGLVARSGANVSTPGSSVRTSSLFIDVPEPSSLLLLSTAALLVFGRRSRR